MQNERLRRTLSRKSSTATNPRDSDTSDSEFEVEKIIGQKRTNAKNYFKVCLKKFQFKLLKVLWKNFPRSAATWEKEENLKNCQDKLQEFLQSRQNK